MATSTIKKRKASTLFTGTQNVLTGQSLSFLQKIPTDSLVSIQGYFTSNVAGRRFCFFGKRNDLVTNFLIPYNTLTINMGLAVKEDSIDLNTPASSSGVQITDVYITEVKYFY